jgi:uncharacterized protein (DUF3820 family)
MNRQDVITFGKHKGKTVQYIIDKDPNYILWIQQNSIRNISFDGGVIMDAWLNKIKIKEFYDDMLENSESIY